MSNITFFGLGNMGGPMAANLINAGYSVTVFDLVPESVDALVAKGAIAASTPGDAVKEADIIISMLPAGQHVYSLYSGLVLNGTGSKIKASAIVIDSSTIDVETTQNVASMLADQGISFVDAPVSGGVAGATNGTLSFMVGGSTDAFTTVKPLLDVMGKNIFHAGEVGSGQIAKVCNNMLLSILMVGTSEALKLGINNGMDPKVLSEIMSKSSGSNWTLDVYNPCPGVMDTAPASNDYKGGFMTKLMLKDLGLAMNTATVSGSATPLGALARNLYAMHDQSGNGDLDFSSIFKQL